MQDSLLSSIATDENFFTKHRRTVQKDATAHEIHRDVKFTSQWHNPENFSTIKLETPMSLKLCKIRKNKLQIHDQHLSSSS